MRLPRALVVSLASTLVAWLIACAGAAPALGGIHIEAESVEVDRAAGVARFRARFDSVPDFRTLDEFGRVADSFQYEIDDDWRAPVGLPPEGLDAIVRGDEIHVADALRIRDTGFVTGPDPDPVAGGWGAIITEVPFELNGRELRFEAPLAAIGDDDGYFAYRLFTTEFGLTVDEVESRLLPPGEDPGGGPGPAPIPLPPAAPAALVAAAVLATAWRVAWRVTRRCRICPD